MVELIIKPHIIDIIKFLTSIESDFTLKILTAVRNPKLSIYRAYANYKIINFSRIDILTIEQFHPIEIIDTF